MIYLIKQPFWIPGVSYFKVGYARDLEKRLTQYEAHCPQTERVSSRPGEVQEESLIHRYLHSLPCIKFIKSEWYQVSENMSSWFIQEFSRSYEDMEREVLKDISDLKDILLKYLQEKYPDNQELKTYKLSKIDAICFLNWELSKNLDFPEEIREFFKKYSKKRQISDRLKYFCEVSLSDEARRVILAQLPDTDKVKYFYQAAGPERCRANSYLPRKISSELGIKYFNRNDIAKEIYQKFSIGEKISLSEAKLILGSIYSDIGYDKAPKATDLQIYFETKNLKTLDSSTGKRIHGYELIKKLL